MLILGVDPGTIKTGYGFIDYSEGKLKAVEFGTICLPDEAAIPEKLGIIYDKLSVMIKKIKPEEFAIESAFYGKNVQSALKIGYAKGAAILAAVHNSLKISEYTPREVKKAVTGNGNASKEQVNFMVKSLYDLNDEKVKFDESDALAVAACHAYKWKTGINKKTSWKKFIDENPDRIIE